MLHEILFFISAFISEIIGTAAGFGSSTIFLPIALFFVDFKTDSCIGSSISSLWQSRKNQFL